MADPGRRDRHVVALLGRFGNQLFQYSFARWLECTTGHDVRFDLSMTRRFGIAGSAEFVAEVTRRAIRGSNRFPATRGRLGPVGEYLRIGLGPSRVVIDMTPSGRKGLGDMRAGWWVGYWQQLKYAELAREELRRLLGVDATPQDGSRKRIAVHVRRGDYVGLGLALPLGWYTSAADEALNQLGDADICVYSDDPRWCEESLQLNAPFSVARPGTSLGDFIALAQADAMISSASTYSWWAGFLGGSRVYYPRGAFSEIAVPGSWTSLP